MKARITIWSVFFLIAYALLSCEKKPAKKDDLILSSSFDHRSKILTLTIDNPTKQDYLLIFSKIIEFDNVNGTDDKIIADNPIIRGQLLESSYSNAKSKISLDSIVNMVDIEFGIINSSANEPQKLVLLEIRNGRTIHLDYSVSDKMKPNKNYTFEFVPMNDVLNNLYNLTMVRKIIQTNKEPSLQLYLKDYEVKDSIEIKAPLINF